MTEKTFTDADLGITSAPPQQERTYTDDEVMGLKPEDQRGVLDNAPDESYLSGAAKNAGTATIKGLGHILGFGGDIRNLADAMIAGGQAGLGYLTGDPRSFSQHMADNAKREAEVEAMRPSWAKIVPQAPDGAFFSDPVLGLTGRHTPETLLGKIGSAATEGVTGGFGPGAGGSIKSGVTGAAAIKDMLMQAPANAAGSAAGEAAGEISPGLAIPAAIIAGGGTNVVTNGVKALADSRSAANVEDRARQIAGQVARESAIDPAAVQSRIDAMDQPNASVAGAEHTSAEVAQDPGITALQRRLNAVAQKETGGEDNAILAAQQDKTRQAVSGAAENAAEALDKNNQVGDVKDAYGINGTDPMTGASVSARNIYQAAEKAASDATDQAWAAADTSGTNMYQRRAVGTLRGLVDQMKADPVYGDTVPNWIDKALDNIEGSASKNGQIPLKTLQDLRSRALSEKRVLDAATNPDQAKQAKASALGQLASVAKDVLSDENNYAFKNADARDAWQKAVDATRNYHETFNAGDLSLLNDPDHAVPTVAPEATIGKLLSGSNGVQNLQLFRKAVGPAADPVIGDFMVGKLTNNGDKIVSQADVEKFMANQSNAQVLNTVPGLRDRIMGIAQRAGETEAQAAQRQVVENFQAAANKNDPAALVRFLDKHGDAVRAAHPNPDFIDALESSARRISSVPNGGAASTQTMDNLANGRIFDILYGKATGKVADTVGGGMAGMGLTAMGVPPGAAEGLGALAGATGVGGQGLHDAISGGMNKFFFGGTRDQALQLLQKAARDPKLLKELMNEPTPERMNLLLQMTKGAASAAGQGALVPSEIAADDQKKAILKADGGEVNEQPDYVQHFMGLLKEDPSKAVELVSTYRDDILRQHPELKDKIDYIERAARKRDAEHFAKGGSVVSNDPFHHRLANAIVQHQLDMNPPRFAGGSSVGKVAELAEEAAKKLAAKLAAKAGEKDAGVIFNGKAPKDFSPSDWGAYGAQHGVPNLGPSSDEEFAKSLVPYKTISGRDVTIPGGFEENAAPFTYYDLLHLKNQGINPNDLPEDVHRAIHNRMINSVQPQGPLSDQQVFNQLAFGMISPNQPLTPNEIALGRVMAKSPEDIASVASAVPWKYGDKIDKLDRQQASRDIARSYGLQAGDAGGTGTSGSADYTRIAEMAQMLRDRPDFFRFKGADEGGASDSENWLNFVNRIASQVPGLSAKTGSLATVWQSPKDAAISAIDRHMATKFHGNLFENPAEQAEWEGNLLDKFNSTRPSEKQASSFDDMLNSDGGRGAYVDQVLAHVNKHGDTTFRAARTGNISDAVPEAMRNVDWVSEPKKIMKISPAYLRALEQNSSEAQANNQGLFANQWMLWDRIRNRLEPHEVLFPGLEKLPKMSLEQAKDATALHSGLGYMAAEGEVKPGTNPSGLAIFSVPPAVAGAGALSQMQGDDSETTKKKGGKVTSGNRRGLR